MPEPTTTAPLDQPSQKKFLVRHGAMRLVGEFSCSPKLRLNRQDQVIIKSDRGTEVGTVLCLSTPETLREVPDPSSGHILRLLTAEDEKKLNDLVSIQEAKLAQAEELVTAHHLNMDLVDIEELFGGERLIFYFIAENRIDFRELVKSMAREFHTRIELRQIGVRDEAKLKADYGDCGKPVCCNTHMIVMPPVSMRMAKLQKSTLDPTKISGRCGRLKCCLRFEQDVYEDHLRELPKIGATALTREGSGKVLAVEILAKTVLLEFEDGRRLPVPAHEIISSHKPKTHDD